MKLRTLLCATLMCPLALVASQDTSRSVSTISASDIPHLRKQGTATQLIVDGKPFLALTGELLNNSATSLEYMKTVWPKIVAAKLNSVLAAVSWAQIEPQEGKFDFSVPDGVIRDARSNNLRLVLLWFGSWKNGLSSYPPDWVKRDFERFPRAQIAGWIPRTEVSTPRGDFERFPIAGIPGGESIEMLSTFSDANRDADARAFAALMRHIKEVDGQQHTVIMIQVENEVGIQRDSRDRSPVANKAYDGPVPKELMDYLQKHKDTLIPEFRQVWEAAGFKTSGTWQQVFGQSTAAEEIFMAWNYARYVGRVAQAGKAEYPLPMFVNAALYAFGKGHQPGGTATLWHFFVRHPGFFAVGGPLDDLMDVWQAGAPQIDLLAPDIYDFGRYDDFVQFCEKYDRSGNPLFIPETRGDMGAKALYAFGYHNAIALSLMGVERSTTPDNDLISGYDLITQLAPLIAEHQGNGTMSAVMLGPNDPPRKIQVGNYTLEVAFSGGVMAGTPPPQEPLAISAAIFIAAGPDEYYAAGSGVTATFSPNTPGPPLAGLATVEEGTFDNGRWVPGRGLAGDDDGQGRYLDLRNRGIQRVTLYRYR